MNFTREPIVETIISAKEGYKLSIKNSKHQAQEEYLVDAVEVVSFSGALFYRSSEKPKPFFLPIHDYEVMEVREARLTIKSPVVEKSIKIGGGKKEEPVVALPVEASEGSEQEAQVQQGAQQEPVRRDRRNHRRNRKVNFEERKQQQAAIVAEGEGTVIAPSVFSHLLKPPESLISDSIQKYKQMDVETPQSPLVVQELTAVLKDG